MLSRVGNLLPQPRDSSEFTDYFFLGFTTTTSTTTCVSLTSLCSNWNDLQALDIILILDNPKYVWRKTPLDLTRNSHTQHKITTKTWLGFLPFILKGKHITLHVIRAWAWIGKVCRKTICMSFDRLSLICDRSSLVDLHNKSYNILYSNFTHKHTLSKSKTRLNVLIMVCQHYIMKF